MRGYLLGRPGLLPFVAAGLSVTAIGTALLSVHYIATLDSLAFFETALEDVSVREHVEVNGTSYTVRRGRAFMGDTPVESAEALPVLALAYEKTVARRSPILSLPGPDVVDIESASTRLASTADSLAENMNKDDAAHVRTNLYPVAFLSSLAESERARRAFLETGSHADALTYRESVLSALDSYMSELKRFRLSFERVVPEDIGSFATPRYVVSREKSINAMHVLEVETRKLRARLLERERCFEGVVRACDTSDLALPSLEVIPGEHPAVFVAQDVRDFLREGGISFADSPVISLASSACVETRGDVDYAFELEQIQAVGDSPAYAGPFFAGDILFMDTEKLHGLPFYSYFSQKGVRYILTRPVAYYSCPFADSDISAVVSTLRVAEFARHHPLGFAAHSEDVVSQRDAIAYLAFGRDRVIRGDMPVEVTHEFTELLLEYTSGGWGIYHTMLDISTGERTEMYINNRHGMGIEFNAMNRFFLRSGFVSFFGLVLDKTQRESLFSPNTLMRRETPFVYYSDMEHSFSERIRLNNDVMFYTTLHTVGTSSRAL